MKIIDLLMIIPSIVPNGAIVSFSMRINAGKSCTCPWQLCKKAQEGSESVEMIATKWTTKGDKTEQPDL